MLAVDATADTVTASDKMFYAVVTWVCIMCIKAGNTPGECAKL